jgi:hypothetical protein
LKRLPRLAIITVVTAGRAFLFVVLSAAVAGNCASRSGNAIDGWQTGVAVDCTKHDCPTIVREATEGLDKIAPGHA